MECKCSICLDGLFSVNSDVSVTPCKHLFHKDCIANAMKNDLQCPNCKASLTADTVKKIHPDVFDELVYSDCSVQTNNFLEQLFEYEQEKRKITLSVIKKIDKENTNLKKTNKSNKENLQTCKLFLKGFQTDKKEWQQKSKILELETNTMIIELRKLNNIEQVVIVSEDSQLEHGNNIEKSSSNGSGSSMESSVNEGFLCFLLYFNLFFVYFNIKHKNKV